MQIGLQDHHFLPQMRLGQVLALEGEGVGLHQVVVVVHFHPKTTRETFTSELESMHAFKFIALYIMKSQLASH